MATYLILGAGPIGRHTAAALLASGDDVVVGTRSGTPVSGARSVRVEASDAPALTDAARGVRSIVVATNPPYHRWATDWPPIMDAVAQAARATRANVVLMGNLYAYGRPTGPMTTTTPEAPAETKGRVRAELWRRLKTAHDAGEFRAAEVRASDYFGPGAGAGAHAGAGLFEALLASKTARTVGDPDAPHAWAYLPDIAATLAAIARSDDDATWGRLWFAPHSAQEPLTTLADRINTLADTHGTVRPHPTLLIDALALVWPMLREVKAVSYQHREPWLVADTDTERLLGVTATPITDALDATIAAYRGVARVS